jgi:hypothetical protein
VIGLLTFSEPGFFLDSVRLMLNRLPFASLVQPIYDARTDVRWDTSLPDRRAAAPACRRC